MALQVGGVPIGFDLLLGFGQGNRIVTDQFVEIILEPVFFVGARMLRIGLRPKVVDVIGAAEFAAD